MEILAAIGVGLLIAVVLIAIIGAFLSMDPLTTITAGVSGALILKVLGVFAMIAGLIANMHACTDAVK